MHAAGSLEGQSKGIDTSTVIVMLREGGGGARHNVTISLEVSNIIIIVYQ